MPLGPGEQQDAVIAGQQDVVKGGDDFRAPDGWQREDKQAILSLSVCHGRDCLERIFSDR
jgi:hypothetical protein